MLQNNSYFTSVQHNEEHSNLRCLSTATPHPSVGGDADNQHSRPGLQTSLVSHHKPTLIMTKEIS